MRSAAQLQAVVSQRTWDKDVLLWIGSEKSLADNLGLTQYRLLDLLDLFDVDSLPGDDEETREQLLDRLRDYLKALPKGPTTRTILVVKSIGLLARYNGGLKAFYDWFIGDFTMVILLLDGGTEKMEWPEEVRCEGNRILGYFSEPGMVKEIFSTSG